MNRLLLSIAAAMLLVACLGTKARESVLLPAVRTAWPEVKVDVERGLADGNPTDKQANEVRYEVDLLTAALETGDLTNVLYEPLIAPWATRGVAAAFEAGEIGPNVALILTERNSRFLAAILVIQERATLLLPTSN